MPVINFKKTVLFCVFLNFVFYVLFAFPVAAQSSVGLYDAFELSVSNSNSYTNPFNFSEIELRVTFTSPQPTRTFTYFGFYDGDGSGGQTGNVWKIRFMPDQTGTWNYDYSWSDGTTGGSGDFTVTSSTATFAPVKVDPAHPHYFIDSRGNPFFWNGETEWFFLSHDPAFTGSNQQNRFAAIDFLAQKKVNNLLMAMANDDTYDVYPWLGIKGTVSYDQWRFNLPRMKEWDDVISYMQSKKVISDLWFYSDQSGSVIPDANSAE